MPQEQAAQAGADWRLYEPLELTPILTAALEAFYEHGFHGTTVRDIARRVGQTVPSLYYHHDSKEGAFVARTKGLSDRQALIRHGLRQAATPVVAYLGVHAVFLVEGAVVVETLFAWPGIGHALVHAVFGRDVPMIQGAALCMGLLFVVFNLLVDAACLALDPRRRMGAVA